MFAPAPFPLTEALSSVEVTHSDQGQSGFQLTFQVGRSGPFDLVDYGLLTSPLLKPFNRVILVVRFNVVPKVLMDGIITQVQLAPSNDPGRSTLTVTGEDVSVLMDLEEKTTPYPAMPEPAIVTTILAQYMPFLLAPPEIIPPISIDVPVPTRMIPQQRGTDLAYLRELAARYSYVFYVRPGLVPGQNRAYWGPPERLSIPQPALSVNMGPQTNVESLNFEYGALTPTQVVGRIAEQETNLPLPVITLPVSTRVPLALMPALIANGGKIRRKLVQVTPPDPSQMRSTIKDYVFTDAEARSAAGLSYAQALVRAQAEVDATMDRVVTATGTLDALRYGTLLNARSVVGVRGVGISYDGNYYVQRVTHSIRKGEYKQSFTLSREGIFALAPLVRP